MIHRLINPQTQILFFRVQTLREWSYGDLSAPYWRLYWNDRPGAFIILENIEIPLEPSNFFLIPPNTSYRTRLDQPVRHFYLHFQIQFSFQSSLTPIFQFPASRHLRSKVLEFDRCSRNSEGPSARESFLVFYLVSAALLHIPSGSLYLGADNLRVRLILDYIGQHLNEPLRNPQLARLVGMNVNAFIRFFRERTGSTPQAYLASQRVEKACILLAYSNKSIEEIAEETGFCNRYHFSSIFKKLRGQGPATFRKSI